MNFPQYTIIAIISVILVYLLDRYLQTGLFNNKRFWLFQAISAFCQLIGDGYLTWRPIYTVNPEQILRIYIFTIPLENFIFGFSMLSLTVIIFETFIIKNQQVK